MQTDHKDQKNDPQESQGPEDPKDFIARVEEDLAALIPGFLQNRKNDIAELQACLAANDYKKIQRIGHTLKGVCGSYGFDLMGAYGSKIEQAAVKMDQESIQVYLSKMTIYLERVQVIYV